MKQDLSYRATRGAMTLSASRTMAALVAGLLASSVSADIGSCMAASVTRIPNTKITDATYVTAAAGNYCEISATVAPTHDVKVRLPDAWKQRYVQLGGGGFDGNISNLSGGFGTKGKDPVNNGYVVAADNGGHRAADYPGPSFAVDRALTLSYATTKIFDTHMVAEALTKTYYGKLARYSYFTGCSNGGKNASVAAANFGQYFDGIIGGDGVWGHADDNVGGSDMAGLTSKWSQSVQVGGLPAAKGAALYQATVAACDSLDGVADGIVSNPGVCPFAGIASSLRCTGADNGSCLTDADIAKVNTHTSPLTLSGHVIGAPWAATANLANVAGSGLASGFLAMAFRSATPVDPNTYNIPAQFDDVAAVLDGVYSMTGKLKGITNYLDQGGKLILYHGWEDTTVPSFVSVNFFKALQSTDPQGSENSRLFMGPGVQHCQNGPGADSFDMLSVMANWVEQNVEPGSTANPAVSWKAGTTTPDISGALFTRPLCAYPRYPRYVGGNPNDAASYSCLTPQQGLSVTAK